MDDQRANREGGRSVKTGARTARSIRCCNRVAIGSVLGFVLGLAELFFPVNTSYNGLLVITGVPLMLLSAAVLIGTIITRDRVASGKPLWQFSLRGMFIVTMAIAGLLGLVAYALRK